MRNREKNEKAGAGHGLIEASGQPVPEPAGRCPLSRSHGAATARNRGAGARSRTLTGALTDGKPLQCVLSEPEREPWNTKSNRPQPSPSNPSPKPRRRTATPPRSTSDPSAATRAAPTCGRPCAASSGSQRGVRATMSNASRGLRCASNTWRRSGPPSSIPARRRRRRTSGWPRSGACCAPHGRAAPRAVPRGRMTEQGGETGDDSDDCGAGRGGRGRGAHGGGHRGRSRVVPVGADRLFTGRGADAGQSARLEERGRARGDRGAGGSP